MTADTIDLSPLERDINRLSDGWIRYQLDTSDLQIRDGLILRFEFTYEISHNMLKRDYYASQPIDYHQIGPPR